MAALWLREIMKNTLLILLILGSNLATAREDRIGNMALFGQTIGETILEGSKEILIGSPRDPFIHYSVPVPENSEIKYFKYYVVKADGESGVVGSISALKLLKNMELCLKAKEKIESVLSRYLSNIPKTQYGTWRYNKQEVSTGCRPQQKDRAILSVSVMDFEFNRKMEDKYISKFIEINKTEP